MNHGPEAIDAEIEDIEKSIQRLTSQLTTLREYRVTRYGPFKGETPHRSSLAERYAEATAPKGEKTSKPPMTGLVLDCLKQRGVNGAKRDDLRAFAILGRGRINDGSFSSTLQALKKRSKIVLQDGRYYLPDASPTATAKHKDADAHKSHKTPETKSHPTQRQAEPRVAEAA